MATELVVPEEEKHEMIPTVGSYEEQSSPTAGPSDQHSTPSRMTTAQETTPTKSNVTEQMTPGQSDTNEQTTPPRLAEVLVEDEKDEVESLQIPTTDRSRTTDRSQTISDQPSTADHEEMTYEEQKLAEKKSLPIKPFTLKLFAASQWIGDQARRIHAFFAQDPSPFQTLSAHIAHDPVHLWHWLVNGFHTHLIHGTKRSFSGFIRNHNRKEARKDFYFTFGTSFFCGTLLNGLWYACCFSWTDWCINDACWTDCCGCKGCCCCAE